MINNQLATQLEHGLTLGYAGLVELRVDQPTLAVAYFHAQQIAAGLGLSEAESSMASYWSLAERANQWGQLAARVGMDRLKTARILEIGSGMGLFTLLGRALGFQVCGVEYSDDRYQLSLRTSAGLFAANGMPPALIQARAEMLPIADVSVDIVVSFQTFEHVGHLADTLREIRRVLRPGGIMFAQVPNYDSLFEPHYGVLVPLGLGKAATRQYLRLLGRPIHFLEHLQWLNPPDLRRLLLQSGFQNPQVGPIAWSPPSSLPVTSVRGPFRFRRGKLAQRIAYRLSGLGEQLGVWPDHYPQIEIYAVAS